MSVSFKYWDECVDGEDLEDMWRDPHVRNEWNDAGETMGSKVHLSRDPDGQPFLTQTEMKAVAGIIVRRHFISQIDSDMLCAIAELESDRRPLSTRYNKKTKETSIGIMQIHPKTAEMLVRDMGYRAYAITEGEPRDLYKPFVNVYLGAAYLKWLSTFDQIERSEEFMIRAYKGGTEKAAHKSTLPYWRQYLSVKESLPSRKIFDVGLPNSSTSSPPISHKKAASNVVETTWDSRTSAEEMEQMWNHSNVSKEWIKSGEKKGKVRISHDVQQRPYLSREELRAVADIIITNHFSSSNIKPIVLCGIAEMVSLRFLNGIGQRTGLMGIDYPTARWLYKDLNYRAYAAESVEDLTKPFVSMYFGAAYLNWLSNYEGRERPLQFVVQAYLAGPTNVMNLQEARPGPLWLKYEEALSRFEGVNRERQNEGSCSIM